MARDMGQRRTLARVDDVNRRGKIIAARRVIFEKKNPNKQHCGKLYPSERVFGSECGVY